MVRTKPKLEDNMMHAFKFMGYFKKICIKKKKKILYKSGEQF
jgi:hypothetical protein